MGKSAPFLLGLTRARGRGWGIGHLMVVQDDRLHAEVPCHLYLIYVRRAAVEADEKLDPLVPQGFYGLRVEPVAFRPRRQVDLRRHAKLFEEIDHQGRRGHAVGIVVAEQSDPLARFQRARHDVYRSLHIGQQKGVGEVLYPGVEEAHPVIARPDAPGGEDPGDEMGEVEALDERCDDGRFIWLDSEHALLL